MESITDAVDLWGAGRLFLHLIKSWDVFDGETEEEELHHIFSFTGLPNDLLWPGVSKLQGYIDFQLNHSDMVYSATKVTFELNYMLI